jgi:hypothetical protein
VTGFATNGRQDQFIVNRDALLIDVDIDLRFERERVSCHLSAVTPYVLSPDLMAALSGAYVCSDDTGAEVDRGLLWMRQR